MSKEANAASTNQTAEKLLQVLEALVYQNSPVKLVDLARELGMNTSTLYRFLTALQNRGYITQQEESGKYALNFKLCYLAEQVKKRSSAAGILHPAVVEAGDLFQESAHLAQEEHQRIVYVDNVAGTSQMLTIRQYIGKTAPMHCTGVGKLLLLEYSDDELERLLAEQGMPRYTEHTHTTKASLCRELEQVRAQGYAFDNEECEIGVRCLAVPVRDYTGKIVAGLSVSGPTARITDAVVQEKLPQFLDIARRASRDLGYTG